MPQGIGGNIFPTQILELLVAIGGLDSPLKIPLRGNGKEWYASVPLSVAEGPANTQ
jgi:hypothetical protein